VKQLTALTDELEQTFLLFPVLPQDLAENGTE